MKTIRHILSPFRDNRGFTLIEAIIVVVVLSVLALAITPRLTTFFSSERENMTILTGMIAKTFDDSFLNSRTNYFAIHLYGGSDELSGSDDAGTKNIFSRNNGISVLNLSDGKFTDNDRTVLKSREFPDSFLIEEVILASGESMKNGTVLVPFYPQGYSDNVIIHILADNENRWSVVLRKYMKEPLVVKDYKTFQDEDSL